MGRPRRAPAFVLAVAIAACGPEATVSPGATGSGAPAAAPSESVRPAATSSARVEGGPVTLREYPVGRGQGPHDVAPAADGGVWYTAQTSGELGWLDPRTGDTRMVKLGSGSAPHGVILGPDGAPWITDSGQNAIVRFDPGTGEVKRWPLPAGSARANLNTAAFAPDGTLWFTGQSGIIGRLDPRSGEMKVAAAPRGAGPYGIAVKPSGDVYFASLAGSYLGFVSNRETLAVTAIDPPTRNAGPRRVWTDANGTVWIAEWNAGMLGRWDAAGAGAWREYRVPGPNPMVYAVYVDEAGLVWVTEWGSQALVRFDPATERFESFPLPRNANVRQLHGRRGEVWGAESGLDRLFVARY